MIYVLFGPPGVGKTYIGKLLSENLNIRFFDADEQITEKEEELLKAEKYNQTARDRFVNRLKIKTQKLILEHRNIIIAEAFTKEKNRVNFYNTFKDKVRFIRVIAPKSLARERTAKRLKKQYHVITKKLFEYFWQTFDEPNIRYSILNNKGEKDKKIISDFIKVK